MVYCNRSFGDKTKLFAKSPYVYNESFKNPGPSPTGFWITQVGGGGFVITQVGSGGKVIVNTPPP